MARIDDVKAIHVVPYSHHDHAWTNTRQWHIWRYIEGFCLALDRMNADPDYTLAIDNVLHSLDAFYAYCPSRVDEFVARVREGRISVANGGMALARPADFDGELLIRNGVAGRKELEHRFAIRDIGLYFNADTACGASQMPQLIRLMGHKYYRFMRPEEALRRLGVPYQFIWRGLDGSEVTVARGEYGACLWCEWDQMDGQPWPERRDAFVKEELSSKLDCALTDQMLFNIGQDDCLPMLNIRDRPYRLEALMREWNEKESSRMFFSTFEAFFRALSEKQLPVWEGPLDRVDLMFNAPFRVDRSLRKLRLAAERRLLSCERLNAIACAMGAQSAEDEIGALWMRLFRFSGHAMQHLLGRDYDEARDGAIATVALLEELSARLADEIAKRAGRLARVGHVVVNPTILGGERVIELHLTTPRHIDGLVLCDARGDILPWQLVECFNGDKPYDRQFNEIRVVTKMHLPPMGYASVSVECDRAPVNAPVRRPAEDGYAVDNGTVMATFKNGLIGGLKLHGTGELLLAGGAPLVRLQFAATRPTDSWVYDWEPLNEYEFIVRAAWITEDGPLRWRVEAEGTVGTSPARLTTTLEAGNPVIQYDLTLDNREGEGYFLLSLPCANEPGIRAGVPFGEESRDPDKELYHQPGDPESFLRYERGWPGMFYANGYSCFHAGTGRLALMQGDLSAMLRLKPGGHEIQQLLYRSIDLSAKTDEWMTKMNSDMSGQGIQHFSFAVAAGPEDWSPAALAAEVQRQRAPWVARPRYSMEPGYAPAEGSLLSVDSDHVQLSAAYMEGNHLMVRLNECVGLPCRTRLTLPSGLSNIRAVDFAGEPLDASVCIGEGWAEVEMGPWKIVTLCVDVSEASLC